MLIEFVHNNLSKAYLPFPNSNVPNNFNLGQGEHTKINKSSVHTKCPLLKTFSTLEAHLDQLFPLVFFVSELWPPTNYHRVCGPHN
jgi:hypothetical protein